MLQINVPVIQEQQKENYLIKGKIEIGLSQSDTSIIKLLISSNEQFLAVILSRGYNNVEEEHKLFIIYDLNTTKQICLGSWTSPGAINQTIQHEFDRHSKFFIQMQQDLVSIVDLKHQTLKNFLVVGVTKFLDISDDDNMYLSISSAVCKYSIKQEYILSYRCFGNSMKSMKTIPNFLLILEILFESFYISIHQQKNQKPFPIKKIMLNGSNVEDFYILQNQFIIETCQEEEMKEIRLREIRSGKILRKSIGIDVDLNELIYQLVLDKNEAFLFSLDENNKLQKFDFLRGRIKEHPFKLKGYHHTFGKRTIIFQKGYNLNLKFQRFL